MAGHEPSRDSRWTTPGESAIAVVVNAAESGDQRSHLVVRARLGVDYDTSGLDPVHFLAHVTKRLRDAAAAVGAELDVLQVGVAGDPRWQSFGPENLVEGRPIP
ncbi:MAG: hypothetical protein ACR2H3_16720 [Acidimicrobiales bacterium]